MRGKRLVIRDDMSAAELRKRARREPDRAAAARMQGIANALDGMTRAEAARLAGMERQALRDAVVRYNAEGLDGLHDRKRPGAKPRLNPKQMEQLRQKCWTVRRWRRPACQPGHWRRCARKSCSALASTITRDTCPS